MIIIILFDSYKELKNVSDLYNFEVYENIYETNNKFEMMELGLFDFKLGVVYYHHGINASITKLKNKDIIFLGFEQSVIGIDYKKYSNI